VRVRSSQVFGLAACNLDRSLHCDVQGGDSNPPKHPGERRDREHGMACAQETRRRSTEAMLDIIFIAVAWAYVRGCDGLLENRQP
jgi:hypothetical protein